MIAVRMVGTFEQRDPAPRPHTADTHDLAGEVEQVEAVEQVTTLVGQRRPVPVDHRHDVVEVDTRPVDVDHQRRILLEPDVVAHRVGQLGHGATVGLAERLLHVPLHERPVLLREVVEDLVDVDAVVPELEHPKFRRGRHDLAVGAGGGHDQLVAPACREAASAPHDVQAGAQPLDVPLPRPGQGLVEVVDVEDHVALGRGELPEVGHVRITTRLYLHAGRGRGGEIHRHDRSRAPEERERRLRHAAVPDGQQLGDTGGALVHEHGDRITTAGSRTPLRVRGAGHGRPTIASLAPPISPRVSGLATTCSSSTRAKGDRTPRRSRRIGAADRRAVRGACCARANAGRRNPTREGGRRSTPDTSGRPPARSPRARPPAPARR